MKSARYILPLLIGIYNILLATSERPPWVFLNYNLVGESYDYVHGNQNQNPVQQGYEEDLAIESPSWNHTTPPVIGI
ncbi:hypothetical protein LOAG_15347 [Loa loa]|uniref:Secreted protein n=1 Tax=Loa loa TaxID=7209 RepID=A0A1I7W0H1_LOALO|nr:hypothetical protein LOAG_15347 [Loa loa]EFO13185.1 hypothetical protein LOAG_15347 [Loa loa]